MAIIKDLVSSYGINASYHRVSALNINYIKKQVVICVSTYVSKETRRLGCDPLDSIDVDVPSEDYQLFLNTNPLEIAYLWLKENAVGFEDSIDDFEIVGEEVPIDEKEETDEEGNADEF